MQGIIRDLHLFNIRIKIIDNAFPDNQFKADFHKMFQLDRNRCGGGPHSLHQLKIFD